MRASGRVGALRVGYQLAATLGAWDIEQASEIPRAFVFRSSILSEHAHWITQQPLDLVLAIGTVEWLWRDIALERSGDDVSVALTEVPIVSLRTAMCIDDRVSR